MFENLTERLSKTLRHLTGTAKLTERNIKKILSEVRKALLEADVALDIVKTFIKQVEKKSLGLTVSEKLSPKQFLIKIVNEELIQLMGIKNETLMLKSQPPVVILIAGLQGSGKTTSVAKLAKHLQKIQHKKVMVASCDVYRPAAIEQLKRVAEQVKATFFPSHSSEQPVEIAKAALEAAKHSHQNVLIVDTAGRLHIDDKMMSEIQELHVTLNPTETLLVVDSMTGQDAVNVAKVFNDILPLTGVILTKIDGDTRGGAALSIRRVTGKPIKFLGIGETLDALEPFHPERIASRILGMGDVLSLIEEIEQKIDRKKAEKLARKISKGKNFNLEDFREQLRQMSKFGGLTSFVEKLPGMSTISEESKSRINDKQLIQQAAIIDSMTPQERCYPILIKGSRKKRIAKGSGTAIQEVNQLLKRHQQMQKLIKKLSRKGGITKIIQGLQERLTSN